MGVVKRHVPVTQVVELRAGEVTRLTMELGAAGSLGVAASVSGPASSTTQGWHSHLVRVELLPADMGEALRLHFPTQGRATMSHPPPDPGLPPGTRLRADERFRSANTPRG
ncbi:hypothetical protein Poly30_44150 [Planctomycetes bacterium Poly30]|uniref:Uncharacterized protein n=1 Tax=Saltatorellus ferox TaxID=2528018 RepID=A0A518EXQ2_9BACT|nr:hypothetical protein Poly30_44150 [Planctomycetes bacterium Poly30]